MIVQLDRIVFDHTPGAAANDALSIRIDRANTAPEWIRGATDTSYAAYALVPALDQQLTIHADFSFPDPLLASATPIEVRATATDQNDAILGNVSPTTVPPGGGRVVLPLTDVQLWNRGIGRYEVGWEWQFRVTPGAQWIDLEHTHHVVYVTLDEPKAPWSQAPGGPHALWLWIRALDWACAWANSVTLTSTGASGAAKKALGRLEMGLFNLGRRDVVPLQYLDAGGAEYTQDFPDRVFFLSAFLNLLDGTPAPDRGTQVNCSDCASALATFANALGCDTVQKQIDHQDDNMLRTNRIVLIGESDPPETHWFSYHEVVVRERASDKALLVHDATLMIDTDRDPTREGEGHEFDLAEGMELGQFVEDPGTFRYAHRLVQPEQWAAGALLDISFRCIDECMGVANPPDPSTQRRYQRIRSEIDRLVALPGPEWVPDLTPPVIQGFTLYDRVNNPWRLAAMKRLVSHSAEFFYVGTGKGATRDQRMRISMAYCRTSPDANEALAWLLAQRETPHTTIGTTGERLGDASFGTQRNAGLFFMRGNAIVQMLSTGRERAPLPNFAREMDDRIKRLPQRTPDRQVVREDEKVST